VHSQKVVARFKIHVWLSFWHLTFDKQPVDTKVIIDKYEKGEREQTTL